MSIKREFDKAKGDVKKAEKKIEPELNAIQKAWTWVRASKFNSAIAAFGVIIVIALVGNCAKAIGAERVVYPDGQDGRPWIQSAIVGPNASGTPDPDWVAGTLDDDHLYGGGGNDWIYGDAGDDNLSGGVDNDYLAGGAGNDKLDGEAGNDRLLGGPGDDTFRFLEVDGAQEDVILDFTKGDDFVSLLFENVRSFADIKDGLSDNEDGDAVLSIGDARITFKGVPASAITKVDFLYEAQ